MTAHLALATTAHIVVVGDKLLTTRSSNGEISRWEEHSNKTIVALTRNANLVISYAGLAHIADKPTDEWLVDLISQQDPAPRHRGRRAMLQTGPALLDLTLGAIRERIVAGIRMDFARLRPELRKHGLEVLITGWSWKRRSPGGRPRVRSVAYFVDSQTVHSGPGFRTLGRINGAPRGREVNLIAIGAFSGEPANVRAMFKQGGVVTEATTQAALIADIRERAAEAQTTIGYECIAVHLPWVGLPVVTFLRDPLHPASGETYWPAVVSWNGGVQSASVASCSGDGLNVFGVSFNVDPPCPPASGLFWAHSQPRRHLHMR